EQLAQRQKGISLAAVDIRRIVKARQILRQSPCLALQVRCPAREETAKLLQAGIGVTASQVNSAVVRHPRIVDVDTVSSPVHHELNVCKDQPRMGVAVDISARGEETELGVADEPAGVVLVATFTVGCPFQFTRDRAAIAIPQDLDLSD